MVQSLGLGVSHRQEEVREGSAKYVHVAYIGEAVPRSKLHWQRQPRLRGARITIPTTVAILGGNSVVGRSLEVLLRGAGYGTRIIDEPTPDYPHDLLEGVRLVLVVPTPSTESRERFLAIMRGRSGGTAIPVLMSSMVLNRVLSDPTGSVPWPCRLEDLKNEIEAALLAASRAEIAATGTSSRLPGRQTG